MIGGNETRLLCPNYNDDERKKKMQTDNVKKGAIPKSNLAEKSRTIIRERKKGFLHIILNQ